MMSHILQGPLFVGQDARIVGSAAARREPPRTDGHHSEIVSVPVVLLLPGDSPRLEGQDAAHVARLAEIDGPFPPILVERRTMRVIDGTHRLMATVLRGEETIEVEFYDGTPADAFLRAVEANVNHGFPLSQADRRAAAERIIKSHPHMSDRAIATVSGLGAKTVAMLRRQSGNPASQVRARVGRDGRVRPLNAGDGRLRAAELIAERPEASLREVARGAGISPATVRDVRKRLERGESPLPVPDAAAGTDADHEPAVLQDASPEPAPLARAARLTPSDPAAVIEKLVRDPSLHQKESGRNLLRLLHNNAIGPQQWRDLTAIVPTHCGTMVGQLARQYAQQWLRFAESLDDLQRATSARRAVGPS